MRHVWHYSIHHTKLFIPRHIEQDILKNFFFKFGMGYLPFKLVRSSEHASLQYISLDRSDPESVFKWMFWFFCLATMCPLPPSSWRIHSNPLSGPWSTLDRLKGPGIAWAVFAMIYFFVLSSSCTSAFRLYCSSIISWGKQCHINKYRIIWWTWNVFTILFLCRFFMTSVLVTMLFPGEVRKALEQKSMLAHCSSGLYCKDKK